MACPVCVGEHPVIVELPSVDVGRTFELTMECDVDYIGVNNNVSDCLVVTFTQEQLSALLVELNRIDYEVANIGP
jgi:hypothetical protein